MPGINALRALITRDLRLHNTKVPVELRQLADSVIARYAGRTQAIIFYGSCLRGGDPFTNIADFYVIFQNYKDTGESRWRCLANALLPPHVHYHELVLPAGTVRCKYGTLTLADFEAGCGRWSRPYLYGRMAQPIAILACPDDAVRHRLTDALEVAIRRLLQEALPLMPAAFSELELWHSALRRSYGTELRAENPHRAATIVGMDVDRYREVARIFLQEQSSLGTVTRGTQGNPLWTSKTRARWRHRWLWTSRKWQGKLFSILLLMQAFFTFDGGIDYIVFKLERHSGETITIPDRVRRWPLIFLWELAWKLYRKGVFR